MKIDRKKIINRCGYDQNECMLLAKHLSACPDNKLISELKRINVWNYGKCELGLWADVLDRLDAILENAVTKTGKWMLRLDAPGNSTLVDDVVTILEFTGHLIEHSIYRYLYGSWSHILALFGSSNLDVLLAVLGLSYNFSKRSNYFIRLDPKNKQMILDRLVSIAETWGGAENGFGLAACCDPKHFPETAGNVYFEYRPEPPAGSSSAQNSVGSNEKTSPSSTGGTIILQALHRRNQSPSEIMEELLTQHQVPVSQQMALFSRVRLATYFAEPAQRHKCIRARLQALSILSYTFEVDERHLYPSLLDELVEVLGLPDDQYMGIKACALRTMTAIVNSHRLGINWGSLVGSTGLSSYHGVLPNLTRKWIQGLVDGSIKAPAGSTNQHFTTALLSFLYHLACYEENVGPGITQSTTLSSSGILDTMMQLISWHTPHNDYLSYVTRAVRVTDQILMSISSSRQHVVSILVDRLDYEVEVVLQGDQKLNVPDVEQTLNTQRSGLMKSILNLLKRLCLDAEWGEVLHSVMDENLPSVLRRIFLNSSSHFTPHLSLFAMETITNYLYTYPSRISAMQDKNITTDILKALTEQPLPQNRDFLVQLPALLNTLALNSRGIEAILSSGVIGRYLNTLVSPEYLSTMKTKRVRDFMSQIPYDMHCNSGQNLSNSLTASQMSNAVHELLRSHAELKPVVSKYAISCLRHVVALGKTPATLVSENASFNSSYSEMSASTRNADGSSILTSVDISETARGMQRSSASTSQSIAEAPLSMSNIQHSVNVTEEDVVMLSGGEDEEDDYNSDIDGNQDRQTNTRSANVQVETIVSRDAIPITSMEPSAECRRLSVTEDTSSAVSSEAPSVPPNLFLLDFMLNMCKFLEKPLVFVSHSTQTMCPQFVSQGGLQVLCDLIRMPGLPYDFPVSATCASLCKIFEDLANSVDLTDVTKPLFQCLEISLDKLSALHNSNYPMGSILLREYLSGEHEVLHELVILASVICILVQMIQHIKTVFHVSLASIWLAQNYLKILGRLYLGVSWEAGIILKVLFGDKDIVESDMLDGLKISQNFQPQQSSDPGTQSKVPTEPIPRFVEALHMYSLIKQSISSASDGQTTFIHKHPELVKPLNRILHVTAFLINSVTELFTALGRFFSNRAQVNYRRRRASLFSSDAIPQEMKAPALAQVADILSATYAWEPASSSRSHRAAASLNYAIRYASIRLTNLLLHDSIQRDSDLGMVSAFYKLNGINLYFGLFRQLISFDLNDPCIRKPLSIVLEEWLVCADRMSNANFCAAISPDTSRTNDGDVNTVSVAKITERVHQCMLPALSQLCSRTDLQDLLSRRAIEHLLSMLVTVVPRIFKSKQLTTDSESSNSLPPSGSWDKSSDNNESQNNQLLAENIQEEASCTQPSIEFDPQLEVRDINQSDADRLSELHVESGEQNESFLHNTNTPLQQCLPTNTDTAAVSQDPLVTSQVIDQRSCQSQPTSRITVDADSDYSVNAPEVMESQDSNSAADDDGIRDPEAVQLMEEMGFARDLAIVALEQTGWNANEAVNLVIATSPGDLMRNANLSLIPGLRRGRTSRRAQHRHTTGTEETSVVNEPTLSADADIPRIQSDAYEHITEFINNFNTDERLGSLITVECPTITGSEITLPSCSNDPQNVKRSVPPKFPVVMLEPFNEKSYNEARESLKQNVFKTCYAIAKRHHSDQILHQIAELFLSSGEHERYINELFAVVTSSLMSNLDISPTLVSSKTSIEFLSENQELTNHKKEYQTVGLHLLALLFTRCPSVCACLAWNHKLPSVLVQFISQSDIVGKSVVLDSSSGTSSLYEHMDVDEGEQSSSHYLTSISQQDYYKTLTLVFLVLDQYERSIQAMRLRQETTKLYASCNNWHWFDNQAMLWHPYAEENMQAIDKCFHKGDLCASCDINRRPYTVEFPTMTQVNLISMHRRPVLLFPTIFTDSESPNSSTQMSAYELNLINTEIPECLNPIERSKLCHALLNHFRAFKKASSLGSDNLTIEKLPLGQSPLPSDCLNAMFRLLLRLCFTSHENADEIAEADFLTTLFSYPHAQEFSAEFSAFVGALISEVFDDTNTTERIMKEILIKMSKYGDQQRALKLATETFNLSLPETNVENKIFPKSYIVEETTSPASDRPSIISFPLSSRQKHLLTQLMDLIMCSNWKSKSNYHFNATIGVPYLEDIDARGDDAFTSLATGGPTSVTTISPASSTTAVTWVSNTTTGQSASTCGRQDQGLTENATTNPSTQIDSAKQQTGYVVLGKLDAMRYLIDLVGSYKSVAEFVAMYKHKHSTEHAPMGKLSTDISKYSFLSYLFSHQLNDSGTTEVTMSLLENLILISCESIQSVIIGEFKASLGRIAAKYPPLSSSEDIRPEVVPSTKNNRIASHMMFLMRILSLPSQLINRVLRLLYKRRVPADIAKLIAIVDCNLPNTQCTISIMLRALESLTLVDRQYAKFNSQPKRTVNNTIGRQLNTASATNAESGDVEMRSVSVTQANSVNIDSMSQSAMHHGLTSSDQRIDTSIGGNSVHMSTVIPITETDQAANRDFETDSDDDDDDEDDNDVTMLDQQEFSHPVRSVNSAFNRSNLILSSTSQGSTSTSLNRVLSDVLAAQADMVIGSDNQNDNLRQPWHSVANSDQEARSVIFVYDDEDEGSSGQGAEGNNSQEEDDDDEVLGEDEDEDDENDDDDDDDEQDDDDAENDPDVEGDDGDVDISGEDEEVAFVLSRSRRHDNRIRPSGLSSPRRRRLDASISLTVSTSRANNDRDQNPEPHDDDDGNVHDETADIVLHDDTRVEDDGSFDDEDIDTYGRDDDDTTRDDVTIILPDVPGVIFRPENRGPRGSNSVAAVVEETLRRVVAPPLNVISSNGLRDFGTNSLSTVNVNQSRGTSGNWDLLFPGFTSLIAGDGPRHSAVDTGNSLPTSTTIFRFGPETSVYVTGSSSSNRFGSSGVNFVSSVANSLSGPTSAQSQVLPAATLANQHPLLQAPTTVGPNVGPTTNITATGMPNRNTVSSSINGLRLTHRPLITNTLATSSANRVFAVLPPIPQHHVPPHYGTRHRIAGVTGSHLSSGVGGLRHHTSFNRLYNTEPEPDSIGSCGSSNYSRSQTVSDARDNRSGPEANALVWTMLTSLAEDQPSPVNSALAAAIFSRFLSQGQSRSQQGIMDVGSRGLSHGQLTPYAGYALPPHYRRWTNLSRMLFGHEIMDLILLSRYHVYKVLEQKRRDTYILRIAGNAVVSLPVVTSSPNEPSVTTPALASNSKPTTESTETSVTFTTPLVTCVLTSENPSNNQDPSAESVVTTDDATLQVQLNSDITCASETSEMTTNCEMPSASDMAAQSESGPTTGAENISNLAASSAPTRPLVLTDEETIQSLVEGGMDPSFLDALPEEMRQEVIADHRYARQVQQQINSMSLPEHINSEWLTGLPPHIQEEVLAQFRQEQQQRQPSAQPAAESGDSNPSEQSAQPASVPSATDSNTAFLVSLPPSVLREVLADMEESQFETLPQYLVVEAHRLRREHEERFARAVRSGILSHSNDSRPDHIWRNFTTASGLIGGHGRWDVRFHSINQFLRHLNTLEGPLNLNNSLAVRSMSGFCSRELVDHEGLTCIVVLLVASSTCSHQRTNIVPTIKKVLRNLSCHSSTRNWIVNTLISLFNGLSEKPPNLQSSVSGSSACVDDYVPVASSSSRGLLFPGITSYESELEYSPKSGSNNTLFQTGFEAALGCWVRIFHPVSQSLSTSSNHLQNDVHTGRPTHCKDPNSVVPVRYIIHPQGAVHVAGVLLETLNELTRAFPSHFYPSEVSHASEVVGDSKLSSSETSQTTDIASTSFWDIFSRLSQSYMTAITSGSTTRCVVRRTRIPSRKRPISTSDKQTNDLPMESTSSKTFTNLCPTAHLPAETPHSAVTADSFESESTKEVSDARQNVSKSTTNCFTALSELLCHQLLHDRPVNQERLITILAGIVKDFLLSRSHSGLSVAQASTHPTSLVTPTTVLDNSSNQQNPADSSVQTSVEPPSASSATENIPTTSVPETQSATSTSPVSTTASLPKNLINPLRPQVIETLCQLVLAPKFTENARVMTSQLITDLAQANQVMKESILRLLCITAGQLISKISIQLQSLIIEVDKRLKDKVLESPPPKKCQIKPSSSRYPPEISRISSYDILPDRFGTPGQMVVVSGDSHSQAATKFSDLQLTSSEVFTCPNNDQCRLRGILGLMLRIAAGDSSLVSSNPIPVSSDDLLSSVPGVSEFWNHLYQAFEKLQALNDQNAVLLLQPLLEVFCLAHIHLVKDTILLRQRPTNNRSNRTNSCSTGASSLIDMVPLLHMCVESPTQSELDSNRASTTDHLAHLYFDLGGPLSPSGITAEEDEGFTTECPGTSCTASSQNSFSRNPIIHFADKYRRGLSQVLRQHGANIGESPFAVFLAYPRVLDFDVKRRFFRQQLQALSSRSTSSNRYDDEPITVSRERIFEDSYSRLHRRSLNEWKHKFVIRFQNEEGQDAGGPLREWFLLMSREIFNPNYCLFRVSPADRVTYTINPSSYINSNHLSYFKFVGRFIAKAIHDNKLLECYFTRAFYKHILGVPVKCSDLESEDYEFFKGLEFLLSHNVSDLGYELTFSTEINEFGKTDTRDLIENGRNVPVTESNKKEYVRLVCQERMTGAIRQQLDAFLSGFYDIIPKRMISIFNEQELELLISGLPNIDISDLKMNTTYSKYQPNSPQIEWFWQALESFDQEDLARFLQFVTGTSKVPLGGFTNLEGMHGPTKFQISRAAISSTSHLPSAHTCFNTLVLPAYENYEQLRSRLLMAIRECSEGYGMA
ncbi:unnamed protein product [Heterobilharzia americana]|nr:unnamed protein product [Heterobilharzia americana]